MIEQRNPAFRLTPEWGERIPGRVENGRTVVRARDGLTWRRRVPYASCCRCGIRNQENEVRRNKRLAEGNPYICGDCRYSDPEYVTMVTTNTKEVACPA